MDAIRHLSELLKSMTALYSELSELMSSEKQAIVAWNASEVIEISKKKNELMLQEHIYNEKRAELLESISLELNKDEIKLADVITITRVIDPILADELEATGDKLVELVTQISLENLSLRMLYTTNSRMVNDFYVATGLSDNNSYGGSVKHSTLHNIVG